MTSSELESLQKAVYHRFVQFGVGMNLIMVGDSRPAMFKAVEAGKGSDTNVPVNYLNSLEHIDKPVFLPDLDHDPTIDQSLILAYGKGYEFESHYSKAWDQTIWRISNKEKEHCID